MAWFDDRSPRHPKVSRLDDRTFRVWFDTLCYVGEHGLGGWLNDAIRVLKVTPNRVEKLLDSGLWDEDEHGLWVHDWQEYNSKRSATLEDKRAQARERQKRHRQRVREQNVTRDSNAVVTRDSHADVTPGSSRAPAGARPNVQDHDQDQEEQEQLAGRQAVLRYAGDEQADEPGLPAGKDEKQEEEPEPSLAADLPMAQTVGRQLERLQPQEAK